MKYLNIDIGSVCLFKYIEINSNIIKVIQSAISWQLDKCHSILFYRMDFDDEDGEGPSKFSR